MDEVSSAWRWWVAAGGVAVMILVYQEWQAQRRLRAALWFALAGALFFWAGFGWPYWVLAILFIGWLLFVGLTVLLRRHRTREISVSDEIALAGSVEIAAKVHAVTIETDPNWLTGASAQEWFHEMFPHLRGVLLWGQPKDGSDVEAGRYICIVRGPEPDRKRSQSEVTRDQASPKALQTIYPRDFDAPPSLPLDDGEYAVEWAVERGIGKEALASMVFRMQNGELQA